MEPLTLSFPFSNKSSLVYELAETFILHILYARNVLPESYEVLRREFAASVSTKETLKYTERKKHKTIENIGEMLHHMRLLVSSFDVERVAVLLGPSVNNPKETYTVDFYPQNTGALGEVCSTKQTNQAKRHLVHKMIEHQSTEECAPSQKTNVFLALQLSEDGLTGESESELQDAAHLFSFRDTFRIKDEPGSGNVGTKRAFGGRKRVKPFRLDIVSSNAIINHTTDGVRNSISSIDFEGKGEDRCTSLEQAAPSNVPQQSRGRWLVLSKGIQSFPA